MVGDRAAQPHILFVRTHPHTGATYRVITLSDGGFGVEVLIPDTNRVTVSGFATKADAEAWIAKDQLRVETESQAGRWFTRQSRPR